MAKLQERLGEYLDRAEHRHERITITRNGKPSAVLISVADAELLDELEDRMDSEEAQAARAEAERDGWVSWREVVRQSK
jgi:prevent-host-death family protein